MSGSVLVLETQEWTVSWRRHFKGQETRDVSKMQCIIWCAPYAGDFYSFYDDKNSPLLQKSVLDFDSLDILWTEKNQEVQHNWRWTLEDIKCNLLFNTKISSITLSNGHLVLLKEFQWQRQRYNKSLKNIFIWLYFRHLWSSVCRTDS